MKTITSQLTAILSEAFEKCGYSGELGGVRASDRPDLCQFQCNGSFKGAKMYKKAPAMIAKDVVSKISDNSVIGKIEVMGAGFINIDLSDDFLLDYADQIKKDANGGIPQCEKEETIFLDYGGANAAKPLHIGHLRSAIIGESLKRIAQSTGRKTIGDVHLGDWGLQMGLVIAELEDRYDDITKVDITSDLLNEVYPFASKKSKEDADFKVKAQEKTAQLQKGDPIYISVWKKIMEVSIADLKVGYGQLGVDFDLWYGESDAEKYVDQLVTRLSTLGLLEESQGAKVVKVAEDEDKIEIPPIIIKKSDGSNIYATTDLATIIEREKDFKPQEIWYVVDSRQSLHFTQVFRCAKKGELVPESTKLLHLGFGTMNGEDGKPYKTRDGGVMKLSDFYNTVYDAVVERVKESTFSGESDNEKIAEISRKITVATIKFGDLINHRMKDYIFDLDKFLATEGKTGSFLLYTVARINSVLKKANVETVESKPTKIYTDTEKDLYIKLDMSNESFLDAYDEKAPNIICEDAYQIASSFSKFYYENHIITETDEDKKLAWLSLCLLTKKVLLKHLDVLGIESVELM